MDENAFKKYKYKYFDDRYQRYTINQSSRNYPHVHVTPPSEFSEMDE